MQGMWFVTGRWSRVGKCETQCCTICTAVAFSDCPDTQHEKDSIPEAPVTLLPCYPATPANPGFVEFDELKCAFFRPDIKVKLGDQCNSLPSASSVFGYSDCYMAKATFVNRC